MNITINVEAPELANAINALAQALSGNGLFPAASSAANEFKEEIASEITITDTGEKVKPAPANKEKPKAAEKPAEEVKEEKSESKPTIALETVRAKLAALSQAGKQKQVKELLTQFGCKKLTDVPAEKYSELLEEAEAL